MDNPEQLATKGTKDEKQQSKSTTQYVLDTTMHKQTQLTWRSGRLKHRCNADITTRNSERKDT